MLKIFLLYALIAGIIMLSYAFTKDAEELEAEVTKMKEEFKIGYFQIYTLFNILLFLFGWFWLPYKVVKSIIKLIKGES